MRPSVLLALCAAALVALGAVIVVAVAGGRGEHSGPSGAPSGRHFDGAVMPPGLRAPQIGLRDQYGRPVEMSALRGKPVIITFVYTHCTSSCPAQIQQIKGALDDLGHDLPAVAVSVEPWKDTPASARHFLAEQGMTGRVRFVLGTTRQLRPVWKDFAIAPQRPGREHQSWMTLVDKHGVQRVGYPGAEVTPERLTHDLKLLESE